MSYDIVDVTPDTTAWLEERRNSVGASEVAAVMGLSPWQTALDIYKGKHGAPNDFDPVLAYTGHASEPIMEGWLNQFSGLDLEVADGFMARSREWPFLHASFDRVQRDPFIPIQMKTAHQRTEHKWDEGIPTDIRVQVQAEMAVAGVQKALVVVWIGGREFRSYWEPRDDRFIREHMIPAVTAFWQRVKDGNPPDPATMGELAEAWPTEAAEVEVPEFAIEQLEKRAFLLATIQESQTEADAIRLAVGQWMQAEGVDTLTRDGRRWITYKKQKGRQSLDTKALREQHPELVAEFTKQGADFLVMRTHEAKEKKS